MAEVMKFLLLNSSLWWQLSRRRALKTLWTLSQKLISLQTGLMPEGHVLRTIRLSEMLSWPIVQWMTFVCQPSSEEVETLKNSWTYVSTRCFSLSNQSQQPWLLLLSISKIIPQAFELSKTIPIQASLQPLSKSRVDSILLSQHPFGIHPTKMSKSILAYLFQKEQWPK